MKYVLLFLVLIISVDTFAGAANRIRREREEELSRIENKGYQYGIYSETQFQTEDIIVPKQKKKPIKLLTPPPERISVLNK